MLRQTLPVKIAALEDKMVVKVSAGRKHTVALTANGNLYVWGSNEFGQLGLKTVGMSHSKKQSQVFPEKIYSARAYSHHGSPNDPYFLDRVDDKGPSDFIENFTFSPLNQFGSQKVDFRKNSNLLFDIVNF